MGIIGRMDITHTMCFNLLDEFEKPYVITAMTKGVKSFKLLVKYPLYLSLNSFISRICGVFSSSLAWGTTNLSMVFNLSVIRPTAHAGYWLGL